MKLIRFIASAVGIPLWWGINVAIKLPVVLLGFAVVPFMYRYREDEDIPSVFRLWQNPEDWTGGRQGNTGSLPKWWKDREGETFWSFYKYHAIRNPADGLRNIKWLNLKINPQRIKWVGSGLYKHYEPWFYGPGFYWYFAWSNVVWGGLKVQWVREKTYTEFKFGTRIAPWDSVEPPDPNGSRALDGASFASKFIPNREWKK